MTDWAFLLLPWETQWWLIALFALTAWCYARGLVRRRRWRDAPAALAFGIGLVSMYVVMQTGVDYYAQYMFFIHRIQHLILHHLGPFLIALSMPSAILAAGAPGWLRRLGALIVESPPIRLLYRILQQPFIAGFLFVGLIFYWLTPSIHFDAMLSARLYWLMNLSMAVDGLLFWWFMLDPRPPGATPVTRGIGLRVLVLWAVMVPQIALGAWIYLNPDVVFDVYAVCGRAWPVSPLLDQQLGGLVTWIPAAMMSVISTLILIRFIFNHERRPTASDAAPQSATS